MADRPQIIVLSPDDDECLDWMSVDWPHPRGEMIARVSGIISEARDVPHAIELLQKAGFEVFRQKLDADVEPKN